MAIATSTAILIAAGVGAAATGASVGISAAQQRQSEKKANSMAEDARNAAKVIESRAAEADATAAAAAKEEARKRLAQQTQTIFTSGLGVQANNKKTTLGVGQ